MDETGYAKINLALHVRERRPDGYHELETLFAFAEHGDRLSVSESDRLRLEVRGPFASSLVGDNLVLRAAEALQVRFDINRGAALLLDKSLPVASGIGGGSADAAAALRLLVRWWGLDADPADLLQIAAGLGADVPACLGSVTAFGTGRGDELVAVDASALSGMPLLLVNPRVPVSTAKIFEMWDGVDHGALGTGSPLEAAMQGRNDLEAPAISIAPEIQDVLLALRQSPGVILARMSGSGATCFALFETVQERDRAAELIAAEHPGWWTMTTCLR
jgi:4-diphosphocytidyl-2-C-methyl-D-erythritol kinase